MQHRRGLGIAGAAAAVVVLLMLLPLLRLVDGDQPDVVASAQTWSVVPISKGGLGEGVIRSVAVGGPGLVAVGRTSPDKEEGNAVVWTSVDGITWTRVPHDEELFGDEGMSSVTAFGRGLVAVGSGVWTSPDGITWSRIPDNGALFGGESGLEMNSVTAGGPGLVAVGSADRTAAVWTSVDGVVWSRVAHNEATFGETTYDQGLSRSITHVTAGGPGLVAVGTDWSGGDADAAVWTSVDGFTWSRVPHDEEIFGGVGHQTISGVTAAGPGLVAVGVERSGTMQGVIWTSADGLTWTRVASNHSGTLDRGEMQSVSKGDSGLIAVGWFGWIGGGGGDIGCRAESRSWCAAPAANSDAAVWTSIDGIAWTRVPHDEDTIGSGLMLDVIDTDRGLIAVGSDGINAAVWAMTPEN